MRRTRMIGDFVQDLRYAGRMMRRAQGFTTVAVLSLGLAIGSNTAVFSAIDGLMPRALPVPHPEQLVYFREHYPPDRTTDEFPYSQFERLKEGLWLVLAGVALGLPATVVTARVVSSRLFGVGATDPLTFAVASTLMIAVAALAGFPGASRGEGRSDGGPAVRMTGSLDWGLGIGVAD